MECRVLGSDGLPAEGASVFQLSYLGKEDPELGTGLELDALRVLRRTYSTSSSGTVALPTFPGTNWIWAQRGAEISTPWFGREPRSFDLQLRSTFSAHGKVFLPPGTPRLVESASVRVSSLAGASLHTLNRSRVDPDGSWGPVPLPVVSCDFFVFQVESPELTSELVRLRPPEPGSSIAVDFHPDLSLGFEVLVLDDKSQPIPGACVNASWFAKENWHSRTACTDASGIARVDGCHASLVYLKASRRGFATKSHSFELRESPSDPIVLALEAGGRIVGRCSFDGKPVRSFRVNWWQDPSYEGDSVTVVDHEDGRFEIEGAPLGEICLMASDDDHAPSETVRVQVTRDAPAEVELRLSKAFAARGVVIDGVTSRPLEDAAVQMVVSDGGVRLGTHRGIVRTDRGGEFEADGFKPGLNVFEVSALGYQKRKVLQIVTDESDADLGIVPLFPKQALEVQLLSDPSVDFEDYRLEILSDIERPSRDFPSSGFLRFEDLDPGYYAARVHYPGDMSYVDYSVELLAGRDARVEVPIASRRMVVEVVSDAGRPIPEGLVLRLIYFAKSRERVLHCYGIPSNGHVEVMAMEGTVAIEVLRLDGTCLGFAKAFVPAGSTPPLEVRLDRSPVVFRVVDSRRNPLEGQSVCVHCADDCSDWFTCGFTDAQGLCTFAGLPREKALVTVSRFPEGKMPWIAVDLSHAENPIDLVFAPDCPLSVQLFERGVPMPGVEVTAQETRGPQSLGSASTDDQGKASFCPVGKGDWLLSVTHPGYWREPRVVPVACEAGPIPLEVRRLGSVQFIVKTGLGNPADKAAVDLLSEESGKWASELITTGLVPSPSTGLRTGPDGRVRVDGLPNGRFQWKIASADGVVVEEMVVVPPLGVATVEATLQ